MMGSGKSTVGRLLAARTGWPYHDNDTLLTEVSGATAREALTAGGEAELRASEAAALSAGLARPAPCFVGAAAGAILDPATRDALRRAALVIWLDAGPGTLARRASGAAHRPWLDQDPEGWMRATMAQRAPLYKSVADMIVHTGRRRPAGVAVDILDWLADRVECAVVASTET